MTRRPAARYATLLAIVIVSLSAHAQDSRPSSVQAETEQWSEDIDFLAAAWRRMHPEPWRALSEAEFAQQLQRISASSGEWPRNKVIVELMRVIASTTRPGRDGHTGMWPIQKATGFTLFPLRVYWFADGIYVIDTTPEDTELKGLRVTGIGGYSLDEIIERVESLVSRESDYWVRSWTPLYAIVPEILEVLFGDLGAAVELEFRSANGDRTTKALRSIPAAEYGEAFPLALQVAMLPGDPDGALYLQKQRQFFWSRKLDDDTLYFQYNLVLPEDRSGVTFAGFVDVLRQEIERDDIEGLIIDVRNNGGGDNTTYAPLFAMLDRLRSEETLPNLYAIIGRVTFSAAINFAVDLQNRYDVTFVGEPTGGSPNQFGDPEYVTLPNSGITVRISTKYWNKGGDGDTRLALEPDVAVEQSASDYFAGKDRALETVLGLIRHSAR